MKSAGKMMENISRFCSHLGMLLRSYISLEWPGNIFRVAAIACCVFGATAVPAFAETGKASYYIPPPAKPTASGEFPKKGEFTAAHKTWAFGTYVMVKNVTRFTPDKKANPYFGKTVCVRINDRGPFNKRLIDVAMGPGRVLGLKKYGVMDVDAERVKECPRHNRPAISHAEASKPPFTHLSGP